MICLILYTYLSLRERNDWKWYHCQKQFVITFKERVYSPYGERPETGELAEWNFQKEDRQSTQRQHKDVRNEEGTCNGRN